MTLNEYQEAARKTANLSTTVDARIVNWTLGLCGESGELADHVKKVTFHGHEPDLDYVVKELGDILWYVSQVAADLGVPLEVVAQRNLDKLAKRYPEGFDFSRSVNRQE